MPKISVIVPVYKVEQYIHRCIDSILNQTFSDFELILVDDGSPDNCGKICDEYAQKDSRIHVIHKPNGGLSDARNAGIEWTFANSDSEWIIFIDSDDWIHNATLEKLYDANISNNTPISSCGFERTTGEEPVIDTNKIKTYVTTPEKFYLENNVNATIACAKLYKKECFTSIRYPVGKLHEDEFTTYKILFEYNTLSIVDAPLYMYFQNENGIMLSQWNPKRLDAIEAYKEQLLFFKNKNLSAIEKEQATALLTYISKCISNVRKTNMCAIKKLKIITTLKHEFRLLLKNYDAFSLTNSQLEWNIGIVFPIKTRLRSYLLKFTKKQ